MALHGFLDDVQALASALPTVKLVIEDPAFPEVIKRIQTLHALEAASPSTPAPTPGYPNPQQGPVGIGLSKALPVLDAIIYARRNPWVPWAVGGGLLLLIGGIGYRMGQRSKR